MTEAATRGFLPYLLLLLLCLGLYLPGISSVPVIDRDEARFAQSTRQMLESGDYLDIRFLNEPRNKKPAAIYWLQAASVAALSNAASSELWPYRVPSLAGAVGAVLLTFVFGGRMFGRMAALCGAALLAASLGLVVEAHLAKTDAVLLFTCVAGQGALAEIHRAARRGNVAWGWPFLFWLAEGAALLVKGPIGPGLAFLTCLSLSLADRDARWLRQLRPLWGVPLFLAIVLPWLVAISVRTGGAFLSGSVGHDFLGKILGAQEGHGAWPGSYLALLPVTFWPGSLLLAATAVFAWRERADPAVRFLIAWAVPFWFMLELVPTKLPNYLLPVFPALAILAGRASIDARASLPRWLGRVAAVPWFLLCLPLAALPVFLTLRLAMQLDVAAVPAALAILILGTASAVSLWRGVRPRLAAYASALALVMFPTLAYEAPRLDPLWLSPDAAAMVAHADPPAGRPVAVVGYDEPSLIFLLGTDTMIATPQQAAASLAQTRGALALVERRDNDAFAKSLNAEGAKAQLIDSVDGLDYSNGKTMHLELYRSVPP
jgi:4-amino-4-deoxy-L-arabinose transferase-like glycosyltransferase